MTNLGECGLVIQQEQAGTVTSAGEEPSSEISVRENSLDEEKPTESTTTHLYALQDEGRMSSCPKVRGQKANSVFTSSRKSPKMRNTAFSFSFLNTIIMNYA